jgi:hypothetical protein
MMVSPIFFIFSFFDFTYMYGNALSYPFFSSAVLCPLTTSVKCVTAAPGEYPAAAAAAPAVAPPPAAVPQPKLDAIAAAFFGSE